MKIKLTTLLVENQDKALRFYCEVLGFVKKADFRNGDYRWLTVVSPDDADGTELQLAVDADPAAVAYRQARLKRGQPALNLLSDDVAADHARISARGGEFTMPPTDVTASVIAIVGDGCGNLVQLTQLKY